MAFAGALLIALGVLGEALLGTWFRGFFSLPPSRAGRWSDQRVKLIAARVMFWLGALLLLISGANALLN